MAKAYILRYAVRHEGSGLVNQVAYLSRHEAESALERYRNESSSYPTLTDEELKAGADIAVAADIKDTIKYEAMYGPSPSYHRLPEDVRSEFIADNSWAREEYIEYDPANPKVLWTYSDYACWIDELSIAVTAEAIL